MEQLQPIPNLLITENIHSHSRQPAIPKHLADRRWNNSEVCTDAERKGGPRANYLSIHKLQQGRDSILYIQDKISDLLLLSHVRYMLVPMYVFATNILLLAPGVYAAALSGQQGQRLNTTCKAIPGDHAWPSPQVWSQLNATIDGRLIQTVPQGAVCRPGGYGNISENEAECEALKEGWDYPRALCVSRQLFAKP